MYDTNIQFYQDLRFVSWCPSSAHTCAKLEYGIKKEQNETQKQIARPSLDGCAVALRRTAWSEHGMGISWQVWIRHDRTV